MTWLGKARETAENQSNLNSKSEDERARTRNEDSIYSESRTKTACFSQNGSSEEMLK